MYEKIMPINKVEGEIESRMKEKEKKLEEIRSGIEKIKDALGRPIDEGIKETVVMCNALGLRTDGSCEGGPEEEHGSLVPWVQVYPEEPEIEGWQENDELREKVRKESKKLRAKAAALLEEFYKERKAERGARLVLSDIAYGFRIQSEGLDAAEELGVTIPPEQVELYKKEMADFTEFLKQKYLSPEF